jgi:HAD superfamily hydrolase (TIGR01459 family)
MNHNLMDERHIAAHAPLPRSGEPTRLIGSLHQIPDRYELLICDVWGVLHDGVEAFPDAIAALQSARARGAQVALATNTQKPSTRIPDELQALSIPASTCDVIVTAGDATERLLQAKPDRRAYVISSEQDWDLVKAWRVEPTTLRDAAFILAVSLPHPASPQDHLPMLQQAADRGLELVCANPDVQVRVGASLQWCAGALAGLYSDLGGQVTMAGKPWRPIYDLIFQAVGGSIDMDRVLVIGDGIATDIRGANMIGADCVFIASGLHGEALMSQGGVDLSLIDRSLNAHGAWCDFVMERLA